jgi:hypothetical protein
VLSKFLTLKAAMVAATASLVLAGVAGAATGNLPEPAQRVAHQMLGAASSHSQDDHASGTNGHSSTSHATGAQSTAGPTGPDATGAAKEGLCQAWMSGQGGENGKKDDSTAFKALAAAAGGADKVADFCKDVKPAGADHGQSTPPSTTPEQSHGGASQGGSDGQSGSTPADTRPQPTQPSR